MLRTPSQVCCCNAPAILLQCAWPATACYCLLLPAPAATCKAPAMLLQCACYCLLPWPSELSVVGSRTLSVLGKIITRQPLEVLFFFKLSVDGRQRNRMRSGELSVHGHKLSVDGHLPERGWKGLNSCGMVLNVFGRQTELTWSTLSVLRA